MLVVVVVVVERDSQEHTNAVTQQRQYTRTRRRARRRRRRMEVRNGSLKDDGSSRRGCGSTDCGGRDTRPRVGGGYRRIAVLRQRETHIFLTLILHITKGKEKKSGVVLKFLYPRANSYERRRLESVKHRMYNYPSKNSFSYVLYLVIHFFSFYYSFLILCWFCLYLL